MTDTDLKTIFGTLVETADGSWTIKHEEHGQDFHSTEGAKFEAWQLYIVASGLLDSLRQKTGKTVAVLDVGMGLGYNACATVAAWYSENDPADLELTSLEIDSRLARALAEDAAPWTRGWDESWLIGPKSLKQIAEQRWRADSLHPNQRSRLAWTIYLGDASTLDIPQVSTKYQFIWQDPFTPELNPTMWSPAWFEKIRSAAAADVTLMTYSVARVVKDALSAGGWSVTRFRTPGRKRHWLKAHL